MFSFSRLGRSSGSFSRLMVSLHSKPKWFCLPSFCRDFGLAGRSSLQMGNTLDLVRDLPAIDSKRSGNYQDHG